MPKKVPMRQCLGKAPGRGAYVCRSAECLKKAMRSHAIDRALGVTVPQELYETLRLEMEALPDGTE